jgi:ribosomal protein S18 acetylase RimI-like enzyme
MGNPDLRPATFPDDFTLVQSLFREYADGLGIDLAFQGFETEVADLPGKYAPPTGGIWLAEKDGHIAGCVALRSLGGRTCEIKRLYVKPPFRGLGLGRLLAENVLTAAVEKGYRRICLDTLPSMNSAIEMYRQMGFEEVESYCHNPIPGALFFAKELIPKTVREAPR